MDTRILDFEPSPAIPKKETLEEKGSDGAGSPRSGQSSPESNCPICLGKPENKSFTDSCLHQFCFCCLLEWSKVKAECPLCKQSFKSIIHTVRSIEDYEQYYLSTATSDQRVVGIFPRYELQSNTIEPFRYRTTMQHGHAEVTSYLDYYVRLEQAFTHHVIPSMPTHSGATHWQRRRQLGTSDFRRNIYQQGLWVQQTRDITGRIRDCSPEFYRANTALVHRLVPWLNRELNVLCSGDEAQVQHVIGMILELVKQVPIRSQAFSNAVAPFIGRHTEHFVHEFYCFASSPFDLIGYDRHANYVNRDLLAHEVPTGSSGSDSDVQIVGPFDRRSSPLLSIQLDSGSDSEECVVVDSVPARQPTTTPEVITLESEPDDDIVQVNIHIGTEPSRPGPSTSRTHMRKRNWVSVQNVQVPTSNSDNVNVSINIAHPSRSRSLSIEETVSDSSSSVWTPHRKKPTKTKIKKEKSKKKKIYKSRCLLKLKKKRKTKVPSSSSDTRSSSSDSESSVLLSRKRKPPVVLKSSSDDNNDIGKNNAHEVTDDYLSTSSDESEYKPRLRSVVIKSNNKAKPPVSPENSLPSSRTDSLWIGDNVNSCDYDYNYPPLDPDVPECSNTSWIDPYGPGCSRRSRSFSSSSSEYPISKKCKYSKIRCKR